MRALLRIVAGVLLVTAGLLALAGGVAAWSIGKRRGGEGAFTATLAPVATDGYAVVVPDVAGVLSRHGIARYLGDGRLTLTVRSTSVDDSDLVVVGLVPAAQAARYLSGLARTEVVAVGYTTGVQPVQAVELPGGAPSGPPPWETGELPGTTLQGRSVTVSIDVPVQEPLALVVRRSDGAPGLSATISASFAPASWSTATTVLLLSGLLGTLSGLAVLMLRRPWTDPLVLDGAGEEPVPARPVPAARPAPARPLPARPLPAARAPAVLSRRLRLPVGVGLALRRWVHRPEATEPAPPESPYVHTAT